MMDEDKKTNYGFRHVWKRVLAPVLRHVLLALICAFWLIPIVWLVCTSFSAYDGVNISRFFPKEWSISAYTRLFHPGNDTANQYLIWFKNTFIIAIFTCIISTVFVLCVAYAMSCMRFRGRKFLMKLAMILTMFPGFLSMIIVYMILKTVGLTNSHFGLILCYSASSGLGYLIAKGFFDTIPASMREAAKIEGASEARVFTQIVVPLSRPIIVYTIISSFLAPWMDFVMAKIMLNSGIASDWTVSIGLYKMLDMTRVNQYFTRFCAGGVLVSIPISLLFLLMQKFYVEGITGGAVKG